MKATRRICLVAVMAIIWVPSAFVACYLKDATVMEDAVLMSFCAGIGYLLSRP